MPIYEFLCKECRNEFKTLRRTDQLDSVTCPTCGTPKVARLLSVTARSGAQEEMACNLPAGGGCCMNPGGCSRIN